MDDSCNAHVGPCSSKGKALIRNLDGDLWQPGRRWHSLGRAWLWLVWPDTHYPEQDAQAVACATRVWDELRPDGVCFLGDLIDCAAFSSHARKSLAEEVAESFRESELDPARDLMRSMRRPPRGRGSRIVFVEGNHENRVERWALANPANRSAFDTIGPHAYWQGAYDEYHPWMDKLSHAKLAPDLWGIHGFSCAKNAATKHLEICTSFSVVHGHTHRNQSDTRRDPSDGRVLKAWSPGCLAALQPQYHGASPTGWSHGVSLVYVGQSGSWTDYTIEIKQGRCVLPDGRQISA